MDAIENCLLRHELAKTHLPRDYRDGYNVRNWECWQRGIDPVVNVNTIFTHYRCTQYNIKSWHLKGLSKNKRNLAPATNTVKDSQEMGQTHLIVMCLLQLGLVRCAEVT